MTYDSEDKNTEGTKDEKLLQEIRTRYSEFALFWQENFDKGDLDIEALGENGPLAAEKLKREGEKRPFVHQDIIDQYNRRIKNQARLNTRGIKINPSGENANTETAERRENRLRQIGYECNAKYARQTALDHAVDRGMGFYIVTTEEANPLTFDQKIVVRPIPNPRSVLIWPYCQQADRSDQEASFIIDRYSHDVFRQKWPGAEVKSFTTETFRGFEQWGNEKEIMVCSYYKRETKKRTLLLLEYQGQTTKAFLDEIEGAKIKGNVLILPEGGQIQIRRQAIKELPKVMHYQTNGLEILKREEWIGTIIPIIAIFGPEKYGKDGKLRIESATRKAIAAQITFDYALMNQLEKVGQVPKSKIMMAEGQQDTATDWENLNRTPTAYATYKPIVENGVAVPPPILIEWNPNIEPMEILKQSAMVAIENAYGISSIQHQDKVSKSGKALKELQQSADVTNYHFQDAADRALQLEGRIENEILEKIEDTDGFRGMRTADGQYRNERITPLAEPGTDKVVEHPYGDGQQHDVVVEVGPDWQSQWDKVSDSLDLLMQDETLKPLSADIWVLFKRLGPLGDKLAKRYQQAFGTAEPENAQADPAMLAQQLQVTKQELEQARTLLLAAEKELKEKADLKAMELASKERMNEDNNAVKLAVANLSAEVKASADQMAVFIKRLEMALNSRENDKQRGFDASQAEQDRALALTQGDQQAQLTREQMAQQGVQE